MADFALEALEAGIDCQAHGMPESGRELVRIALKLADMPEDDSKGRLGFGMKWA